MHKLRLHPSFRVAKTRKRTLPLRKATNLFQAQLYQDIYFEIEQLCNTTVRCQENYSTIEKRLEYCSEIYEMRKEQFQHGVLSITDYLIAENKRKNVELLLTYEKYYLLMNLKLIDHYLGK